MALANGSFNILNGSTIAGTCYWEVTAQSLANKTSTVYWYVKPSSTTKTIAGYVVSVNGSATMISQAYQYNLTTSSTIVSNTETAPHKEDGSGTMRLSITLMLPSGSSFVQAAGVGTIELPTLDRTARVLTADNFTDEDNPTITYKNPTGNTASLLQACISFTGGNDDIPYRDIPKTGSSYTFNLTDDERNTLRLAAVNAPSITVRFYVKVTVDGTTYWNYVDRTFTVVNCNPILDNPTVKDIKPETLALTGDENTVVRYESMIEYGFEVTPMKQATIVSQGVQCGNKTVTGLSQGVIDDVESNLFVFSATDSRGLTTTATVEKNLVDYLKPTCYQTITTELEGETGAKVNLVIHGNYYHGSFGAVNNTLKIEVRHTQNDGTMGDWVDLSPLAYVVNGNTYELETTITGFDYSQGYTFQSRVTDKLNIVQSAQYVVKVLPVFDWDDDDFNFNVPVNMNGETVLRHNKDADNVVLSASGGHIYLRPKGTNSTSNETIFNPDGSVDFTGPIRVNGEEVYVGEIEIPDSTPTAADYIVETGTESMGSNGTWYWEKWNSGKAVCWGMRNFGRMQTSTTAGSIYLTPLQNQSFPSGLFIDTPAVVHIQTDCRSNNLNYGGWIMKDKMTTSAVYFYIANTHASTTMPVTHTDFHIIGRWK